LQNPNLISLISSKDFENLETSPCPTGRAENQYQMLMAFGPSGGTALEDGHGPIMGSGTLPRIIVCGQSSPCHPQMQVEGL